MLANYYAEERAKNLNPPASWCGGAISMKADIIDLYALRGAIYLPDGKTIILRDGSQVRKTKKRKHPWNALGE